MSFRWDAMILLHQCIGFCWELLKPNGSRALLVQALRPPKINGPIQAIRIRFRSWKCVEEVAMPWIHWHRGIPNLALSSFPTFLWFSTSWRQVRKGIPRQEKKEGPPHATCSHAMKAESTAIHSSGDPFWSSFNPCSEKRQGGKSAGSKMSKVVQKSTRKHYIAHPWRSHNQNRSIDPDTNTSSTAHNSWM
jgi:hypothetical protein